MEYTFINKKTLLLYAVSLGILGVMYSLWILQEKNTSYQVWQKDAFVKECTQSNELFLEMIGKNSDEIDIKSYCQCYAEGGIELSKQKNLDLENDIIWVTTFWDDYSRKHCANVEIYNQLTSSEHATLWLKACELYLSTNNKLTNAPTDSIDCTCFAENIERLSQEWTISSFAWMQLYMLQNTQLLESCKVTEPKQVN